jgi:hypothetical protein
MKTQIEQVRAQVKARVDHIEAVQTLEERDPFHGESKLLFLDVGARDELRIEFTRTDWRMGWAEGVQVKVTAPSSKWSFGNQWHVNQTRTFRTGKDGVTLNGDGIAKAVEELAEDLRGADRQREAKAAEQVAKDDLRETNRKALVEAGLLRPCDPEDCFQSPEHHTVIELRDGVKAELDVSYRGPVTIEIKDLTPAQAATILGRLQQVIR